MERGGCRPTSQPLGGAERSSNKLALDSSRHNTGRGGMLYVQTDVYTIINRYFQEAFVEGESDARCSHSAFSLRPVIYVDYGRNCDETRVYFVLYKYFSITEIICFIHSFRFGAHLPYATRVPTSDNRKSLGT